MAQKSIINWPTDAEGNPLALISAYIEETIPTAQYANVKISQSIQRFVPDDDSIQESISAAYDDVDEALQPKRDQVIDDVSKGNY